MLEQIARTTESRTLQGRSTFPLDGDDVLIITSGRVDLFVAELVDGHPIGRRQHVLRVPEGQPVIHLGELARTETWGLIAVGKGDTTVQVLSKATIREWTRDPQMHARLTWLIERWVALLTGALAQISRVESPDDAAGLPLGAETPIPPNMCAQADVPVAWIRCVEGTAHFMTNKHEDAPELSAETVFPLADAGWIYTQDVCSVTAVTADQVGECDALWAGLEQFHRHLVRRLATAVQVYRGTEQQRLAARVQSRRSALGHAFRELGAVLSGLQPADLRIDETDPHYAAAQLVAHDQNISLSRNADDGEAYDRAPIQCISRASGVQVRKVALRGEWWTADSGPLYATLEEDGRPVALLMPTVGQYEMHDPSTGTVTPVDEEVAEEIHPFGYSFYRSFPQRSLTPLDILRFSFDACRRDLLLIVLLAAGGGLLSMLPPIVTGMIFQDVIPGAERGQLLQLSLALVVVAFVAGAFRLTQSLAIIRVQGHLAKATQSAVWDRLLSLPLSFFRSYSSGDLAMRAMGFSQMQKQLSGPVVTGLLGGVFSMFNYGLLYYYSPYLAKWATVLGAIAFLVIIGSNVLQLRYQRKIVDLQNELSSVVLQFLTGISKLRIAGAEAKAFSIWASMFGDNRRFQYRSRQIFNAVMVFNRVFPMVVALVIFALAVPLVLTDNSLSMGHLLAFLAALTAFISALTSMGKSMSRAFLLIPLYEKAAPLLEAEPEVNEAQATPGPLSGDIELQHVSFRYDPESSLVLKDVSFRVGAGEFVALVGPSGSGKSTLFKLILGFESPEKGAIYFDDQDLDGLDVRAVRRQMGVVVQNGKLMPGDIYQNIAGAALITRDDAWDAARVAELDGDIKRMPMGMHTVVSEGGSTLSGGQIQRLMIARAVVSKPRILLFDEATSALDNKTQQQISRSLERMKSTRVVIAHRLSTIRNADRILVLKDGEVAERGTYDELMEQDGPFAELARRQMA